MENERKQLILLNLNGRKIWSTKSSGYKFAVTSASTVAGKSISMANSVRVGAAQMTSVNNLAVNFSTCSRLVKSLGKITSGKIILVAFGFPTVEFPVSAMEDIKWNGRAFSKLNK
ncbi:hypothetical protein RND71_025865 [Anisodus tanguticus]|uniref:Uncharacterized protein n=1 Tax=Anisodus tanguticus TaxID=243964 RepID=A0AAE1RL71_9SOLA|nr:hypothetical protein RND71_025865 [Anisodus tanguticus]